MAQGISGTIQPGPLAVPQTEHAIDLFVRIDLYLLRTKNGRRRQIFVDCWQKLDSRIHQPFAFAPQLEINTTERRPAIT